MLQPVKLRCTRDSSVPEALLVPGAGAAKLECQPDRAELPLQRTLDNESHMLDDSGQLSSASATPVPAGPSPGKGSES